MVGQVKIVGILMIVHGITVIIMGGLLITAGIVILTAPPPPPAPGGPGGQEHMVIAAIYLGLGSLILAIGLMNSVAGIRIISFRGRSFALVALFCNVVPVLTCYCSLTAIGMMIYGLIVLFQSEVARAFELVSQGATPEDVIGRLTRRYGDDRDDYDESYRPRPEWEDEDRRRDDDWRRDADEGR
jgi:hypothetical protein